MGKLLLKLVSLVLAVYLYFSVSTPVLAATVESASDQVTLDNASEQFTNMTNDELNDFIDGIAEVSTTYTESLKSDVTVSYDAVQLAWLAAAQIARNNGYPCAATLVECSVKDIPYSEGVTGGQFQDKIRTTSVYQNYIAEVRSSGVSSDSNSFAFTKSDNEDLFYALHNVNVNTTGHMVGTVFASYAVTITDVFDFDYDNDYDDLFTSLVNNWAWLCQQTHVLNNIPVRIDFID